MSLIMEFEVSTSTPPSKDVGSSNVISLLISN